MCASPGRDRNTDEKKLSGDEPSSSERQDAQTGVTTRRGGREVGAGGKSVGHGGGGREGREGWGV